MARTAVVRIFLVVVLAIAAHNLKPFSLPGIAGYVLEASTSFDLVLPHVAVSGLEGASLMVAALGSNTRAVGGPQPQTSCPTQSADEGLMAFRSVVLPEGQIKVAAPKRPRPAGTSTIARRARGPRPEAIVLPEVRDLADFVALRLPSRDASWMPIRNELMTRIARRITLPAPKRAVVRPAALQIKTRECESEKMKEMRIAGALELERKKDEMHRWISAERKMATQEEGEATHSEGEIQENDVQYNVILKCS